MEGGPYIYRKDARSGSNQSMVENHAALSALPRGTMLIRGNVTMGNGRNGELLRDQNA
jgi:hypothetical protein